MILRAFLAACGVAAVCGCAPAPEYDVVIRGGTVYDGNPEPPRRADVGIKGDRVVAVGDLRAASARTTIEAPGQAVVPGMINVDSRAGGTLLADGVAESDVRQGITTEILLRDSAAYWTPDRAPALEVALLMRYGVPFDWSSLAEYFARVTQRGTAVNVATLVPVSFLREAVVQTPDRVATGDELARLAQRLDAELRAGALGVVLPLPAPDDAPAIQEAALLAQTVDQTGGRWAVTLPPGTSAESALDAIGRIAASTGAQGPVVLLDTGDPVAAETAIRFMQLAAAGGIRFTPVASGLASKGGGSDEETRRRGLIGALVGTGAPAVRRDGPLQPLGNAAAFGAFPRLLGPDVRSQWLTLQLAVYYGTRAAASAFGFPPQLGAIRQGSYADIVVLDPASLADRTGPDGMPADAAGINYVIVNGVVTLTPQGITGALPGRSLSGPALGR